MPHISTLARSFCTGFKKKKNCSTVAARPPQGENISAMYQGQGDYQVTCLPICILQCLQFELSFSDIPFFRSIFQKD